VSERNVFTKGAIIWLTGHEHLFIVIVIVIVIVRLMSLRM